MIFPNIVFLISAPYSGATLLSILMNQHPGISSDGEIFPYDRGGNVVCSCGKNQIDCEYYRTVARCMIKGDKKEFDGSTFYYVPRYSGLYYLSRAFAGFWIDPFANQMRNTCCTIISKCKKLENHFINIHLEFIRKSLDIRNASIYLDGTKSLRRAELFAERRITFKMVHLIRDGRAFCYSFLKNKKLNRKHIPMAAKVWKKSIRKVDTLRGRFPHVQILDVRYNDLCDAPGRELKRLFAFMEHMI